MEVILSLVVVSLECIIAEKSGPGDNAVVVGIYKFRYVRVFDGEADGAKEPLDVEENLCRGNSPGSKAFNCIDVEWIFGILFVEEAVYEVADSLLEAVAFNSLAKGLESGSLIIPQEVSS